MVTGKNRCPMCKKLYSLGRRSRNPQSIGMFQGEHICMKCFNNPANYTDNTTQGMKKMLKKEKIFRKLRGFE